MFLVNKAPHSQVFNVPVVAYFLFDRLFGLFAYRTGQASIIHKEMLDQDYMVVFLYIPHQKRQRSIGSTYYLSLAGLEGAMEIAHPYVTFQNHTGEPLLAAWTNRDSSSSAHAFYVDRSAGDRKFHRRSSAVESVPEVVQDTGVASESEDTVFFSNWNTAAIVQVHRWTSGDISFTGRLSRKEVSARLRFWGPYLSEYAEFTPDGRYLPPLVLIGTGAGCGPIVDFYMYFTANGMELTNPVSVYFSTNSIGLFQFFTDLVCSRVVPNFTVNAHLTSADDFDVDFEQQTKSEGNNAAQDAHAMKLVRRAPDVPSFIELFSDQKGVF